MCVFLLSACVHLTYRAQQQLILDVVFRLQQLHLGSGFILRMEAESL